MASGAASSSSRAPDSRSRSAARPGRGANASAAGGRRGSSRGRGRGATPAPEAASPAASRTSAAASRRASTTRVTPRALLNNAAVSGGQHEDGCRRCLRLRASGIAFVAQVPGGCEECYFTYLSGSTHQGTWEDVCAHLHQEGNETDNEYFSFAVQVRLGLAKPHWFPTGVRVKHCMELAITRSKLGLTKAGFKEMTGEDAKPEFVTFNDLPDENDKLFKGTVVANPARPHLEYNFAYKMVVDMTEHRMAPKNQLFEKQASETFNYMCDQVGLEDNKKAWWAKLAAEPLTVEALKARIELVKRESDVRRDTEEAKIAASAAPSVAEQCGAVGPVLCRDNAGLVSISAPSSSTPQRQGKPRLVRVVMKGEGQDSTALPEESFPICVFRLIGVHIESSSCDREW
jgi:hypothetical protein